MTNQYFFRILILDDDPRDPENDPNIPNDHRFWGQVMYVRWIEEIFQEKVNYHSGYRCQILRASTANEFKLEMAGLAKGEFIDLAIVDMVLKEWSKDKSGVYVEGSVQPIQGREMVEKFSRHPSIKRLAVLTAEEKSHPEKELIGKGAVEYFSKLEMNRERFRQEIESIFGLPSRFDLARFKNALKKQGVKLEDLRSELNQKLIGDDVSMLRVKAQVCEAVLSKDIPVLIMGETGTGKEEVANIIHAFSRRGKVAGHGKPVALNCAEFVEEDLLRAELFGHTKGAFTGAAIERKGKIHDANGSTLFLDEVGLAQPRFQTLMLRAMEEQRATPLGGSESYQFDIRFIAATDQDVFGSTQFSKAFLHRLSGLIIQLPPLRKRKSDIRNLALHFTAQGGADLKFTEAAYQVLENYDWPGNVRQLKHVIEVLMARATLGRELITRYDLELLLPGFNSTKDTELSSKEAFDTYTGDGYQYDAVKARFLADYVHHQHEQLGGGERNNDAYARTAQILDCSISTLKERLADYRRFFESSETTSESEDHGKEI